MRSEPAAGQAGQAEPATLVVTPRDELVTMFERLARDKDVDPVKLRELVDLKKSIDADRARQEFESAFVDMQKDLPIITERGEIAVGGTVRSKFARHEDIADIVRPILAKHGFGLRHQNESLDDGRLKITAILSHRNGHHATDEFLCPADTSGSKNSIQAMGSTREYGRRYTTLSILNIVTSGTDDDGVKGGRGNEPPAPSLSAGRTFDEWWADMESTADTGLEPLKAAWTASAAVFRKFVATHRAKEWEALKARAKK